MANPSSRVPSAREPSSLLDGDRAANDRHRRDRRGRSSHDRVLRAIGLLRPEYRHLYSGLLCTVDVANDPVAVHDALAALCPPRVDYLLPHSTWDSPPPRPDGSPTTCAATPASPAASRS